MLLKTELFPFVLALKANNCEYRGSSCIPFSSIESIALCRAFKFSCPCPGCPGGPGGPDGGPCGPGDDEGFYQTKYKRNKTLFVLRKTETMVESSATCITTETKKIARPLGFTTSLKQTRHSKKKNHN